ncbi:hypothetical protein MauCBS54593_005957 [Microsporum audouinii]
MQLKIDEKKPGEITVFTGAQRPDLLALTSKSDCPLIFLWPEFLDGGITTQRHFEKLYGLPQLAGYQLIAVHTLDGKETVVGSGNSTPFFWRELADIGNDSKSVHFAKVLQTLPDGGFDTMLARGVHQAIARRGKKKVAQGALTHDQVQDMPTWTLAETPNALSALSIAVLPAWRSYGVAEMLIKTMKETARREDMVALVVPLRPTRKTEFQDIDMAEYVEWTKEERETSGRHPNGEVGDVTEDINKEANEGTTGGKTGQAKGINGGVDGQQQQPAFVPFDPWLRKHVRLGARMVKIAPFSMTISGNAAEWEQWCGIDVRQRAEEAMKLRESAWVPGNKEAPVIFKPKGCLAPMRYYPSRDVGEYLEPNVWLFHSLDRL